MRGYGIDSESFARLVKFQLENGVRDIVVNGTTGESPTTSDAEKLQLVEKAIEHGAEVIAGCGSNDTMHTGKLIEEATGLGIKRILLVDPYYNGPSSLEIREEHYGYLCTRFPNLKFIAYVIPGRTGCEITPDDLAALHQQHPNLDVVKEASGNLERMRRTHELASTLTIMSGDDDLTYKMMTDSAIGAAGVISVASNVAPTAVNEMCKAAREGRNEEARKLAEKLAPLFSIITVKVPGQKFRNPVPFKTAMAGLGMLEYSCRKPLGKMSREGMEVVRGALRQLWQQSPDILQPVAKFYDVDIGQRLEKDENWISY